MSVTITSNPPPAGARPSRLSRPVPFGAGLLAVATLFLILAGLGAATDWWSNDESFTWYMIQHPAREIVKITAGDLHPPLHYLALKAWHTLLPQPRGMRLFSMGLALTALAATGLTGRRLGGARLGLLAALLWAVCPLFLHHSQEGRMYMMGLCCESVALLGWAIGDRRPRLGWVVLTLGLLAAFYTHNHCLIFGAALTGGELLRSLWARRRGAPEAARGTGPLWIFSAGLVVALVYLPWFFVLLRQIHSDDLHRAFQSPTWAEVANKLFYYSYHETFDGRETPWGWAPGVLLLGLLPALGLLRLLTRGAGENAAPARPAMMVAWVGAGPFLLLVLVSMFVNPMFEICRHGLLFIPFLLFMSAVWLASAAGGAAGRAAVLIIAGAVAALSLNVMSRPRDTDWRAAIDALNERAPLGAPIVFYPPAYSYAQLMWSPLAVKIREANDGAERLTSCTLAVSHVTPAAREEIKRQVKRVLAQAGSAREIYSSYKLSAYTLTGLPRGAIDALLWREPETGADGVAQLAGRWLPEQSWGGRDLRNRVRPEGELTAYLARNPKCLGVRLGTTHTTLSLPAARGGAFTAMMLGGYYVPGGAPPAALRWSQGGTADETTFEGGDFMIARLTAGPAPLGIEIPEALVRRRFAPQGDANPGVYLAWAGVRALRPEEFRAPGFKGEYFDVGGLGDELFLRSGLNEAEGAPPAEARWTRERFVVELPVWPGAPVREVVLLGILPAAVRERTVAVEISGSRPGMRCKTEATFAKTDYGEYVLRLPEALEAGVYHFAFTVGTYSPREAGQGSDDRRLGFFLNALGLR